MDKFKMLVKKSPTIFRSPCDYRGILDHAAKLITTHDRDAADAGTTTVVLGT